jgi:hypothetical protein
MRKGYRLENIMEIRELSTCPIALWKRFVGAEALSYNNGYSTRDIRYDRRSSRFYYPP